MNEQLTARTLLGLGVPKTEIARRLGRGRRTIERWEKKGWPGISENDQAPNDSSPSEREDAKSVPHVQPEPQESEPMNGNKHE